MAVEARMKCESKMTRGPQVGSTEVIDGREVVPQQSDLVFKAMYDAEDEETRKWSLWTPSATLEMTVMNPEAARYFEPGETYRVVITKMQPQQARS